MGPACLGVVEQIDQRLPGHNARLHRRGQLAVHSLAVSLAIHTEFLRKGLGSHAREPRRAPRRARCRSHRDAGRIALHRDQCKCVEHLCLARGLMPELSAGTSLRGCEWGGHQRTGENIGAPLLQTSISEAPERAESYHDRLHRVASSSEQRLARHPLAVTLMFPRRCAMPEVESSLRGL